MVAAKPHPSRPRLSRLPVAAGHLVSLSSRCAHLAPLHPVLCSLWQRVRSYFEPSVPSTTLVNDGRCAKTTCGSGRALPACWPAATASRWTCVSYRSGSSALAAPHATHALYASPRRRRSWTIPLYQLPCPLCCSAACSWRSASGRRGRRQPPTPPSPWGPASPLRPGRSTTSAASAAQVGGRCGWLLLWLLLLAGCAASAAQMGGQPFWAPWLAF